MARGLGSAQVVNYNGTAFPFVRSVSQPESGDQERIEVSAAGDTAKSYLAGLVDVPMGELTVAGFLHIGTAGTASFVRTLHVGDSGTVVYYPEGTASSSPYGSAVMTVMARRWGEAYNAGRAYEITFKIMTDHMTDGLVS